MYSYILKIIILFSLFQSPVFAQQKGIIEGEIINGTTGEVGKADKITMFILSMGMREVKSIENVNGKFRIDDFDVIQNVPYLLQTIYNGVVYNSNLKFITNANAKVNITVFEKTESEDKISVFFPHMVIRLIGDELVIDKLFEIRNTKKPGKVFHRNESTFRFYLPDDIKEFIRITASTGPVSTNQTYNKTNEEGVFSISYPVKPGSTQIEISYIIDYSKRKYTYSEKMIYNIDELSVIVSPDNLNIESDKLKISSDNVGTNFKVYNVENLKKGSMLNFKISGGDEQIAEGNSRDSGASTQYKIISIHPFPNRFKFFAVAFLSLVIISGILIGEFIFKKN